MQALVARIRERAASPAAAPEPATTSRPGGFSSGPTRRRPRCSSGGRHVAVQLGFTLWETGEQERARRIFAEFERFAERELALGNEDPELRYSLAALHAIQGNATQAFRWLDEMLAAGWSDYLFLARDPLLVNLHGDERFERIVARNRAEIERQRARVEREAW
jgi:hypothetical protein